MTIDVVRMWGYLYTNHKSFKGSPAQTIMYIQLGHPEYESVTYWEIECPSYTNLIYNGQTVHIYDFMSTLTKKTYISIIFVGW